MEAFAWEKHLSNPSLVRFTCPCCSLLTINQKYHSIANRQTNPPTTSSTATETSTQPPQPSHASQLPTPSETAPIHSTADTTLPITAASASDDADPDTVLSDAYSPPDTQEQNDIYSTPRDMPSAQESLAAPSSSTRSINKDLPGPVPSQDQREPSANDPIQAQAQDQVEQSPDMRAPPLPMDSMLCFISTISCYHNWNTEPSAEYYFI